MNFFPGRVDEPARRFVAGELAVELSPEQLSRVEAGAVTLGVRPEHIEIAPASRHGWIAGRVYVSESMGNENLVVVDAAAHRVTCRAAPELQLDFEAPVWMRFRPEKLHLFDTSSTRALWP